jgi:hypothetical protein
LVALHLITHNLAHVLPSADLGQPALQRFHTAPRLHAQFSQLFVTTLEVLLQPAHLPRI